MKPFNRYLYSSQVETRVFRFGCMCKDFKQDAKIKILKATFSLACCCSVASDEALFVVALQFLLFLALPALEEEEEGEAYPLLSFQSKLVR